jgi:HlyD family secretion protein
MKKKIFVISSLVVVVVIIIYLLFFKKSNAETNKFVFANITKGDLSTTITSTGTLQAVTTVDVGTQVSGKIDKLLVDFNYTVKKNQLLAILDTTNLALQVSNAITGLQKAQASYEVAKATFERDTTLYTKKYMSELDFITSKTSYQTAIANLNSAKSSLAQAKTNLSYAYIYSPINGKIINRNVEEGQTVASSLSAPTLFTIAEDLSKMQILTNVDESDIGQIKDGQDAQFTVQAYPDKKFAGKVFQIRLGSSVISNVVNYIVVVTAENDDKLLLPGMTATVDFYVEHKTNVLMIPNSALRFQPTDKMKEDFAAMKQNKSINVPDSLKQSLQSHAGNQGMQNRGSGFGNPNNKSRGSFWYINVNGNPSMGSAVLGLSDGKNTEVIKSRELKDGMQIITGFEAVNETKAPNSNILNPNQNQNMPRSMRRSF